MIKQIYMAICDLCGKTEPAKTMLSPRNEEYYKLPPDWGHGANKNFTLCPKCWGLYKDTHYDY